MSVFLLTWNPDRWVISDEDWQSEVDLLASGNTYEARWSIGSRTSGIHPGDTVFLVRLARDRGIVASGIAISAAFRDLHWDEERAKNNDLANFVLVEWNTQVEIENRLKTEDLLVEFPSVAWKNLMGSGVRVGDDVADQLVDRWFHHIGVEPETYPDEVPTYVEGASKTVLVNKYERNPAARRACLEHHGAQCTVCGFDGSVIYGTDGDGLIHVHHLQEISGIGKEYEVDPHNDLVPVCPNCHAMIHRRRPAYSIAEVRKMIAK